jgi:hypothetical protein
MINPPPAVTPQPTTTTTSQLDVANLLKILQKMPQQQPQQPPLQQSPPSLQPIQQSPLSDLERTINMFRQQQNPPLSQPPLPQPPASQPVNFQKLLAVLNAQKQMQQPNGFPSNLQSQAATPPSLAAIISQFSGKSQSIMHSQPQQHNQIYEDPDRKRLREPSMGYDGTTDDKHSQAKRTKTNGDSKPKKHVSRTPSDSRPLSGNTDIVTAEGWPSSMPVLARWEMCERRRVHIPA